MCGGWGKVSPGLCSDTAPSVRLVAPGAQAARTHPGAPRQQRGGSPWPPQPALAAPKHQHSPLSSTSLKLSIWETLLGLTPVVIPAIIPITLASALSQRAAVTGSQSLESWAEVTTFIMLAIQIVSYMGIVAITDNVLKNHKAELAQYEDNQEVLKLDRKAEADAADFKAATELATMPGGMKFLLYSATACCWTAGFMQLALMDYSFEAFEVTDPVSEVLCLSCDKAVVKPMGWFSIGAMCVGTVALVLFNQAGSARVAKMAGGGAAAMI